MAEEKKTLEMVPTPIFPSLAVSFITLPYRIQVYCVITL